MPGSVTDILQRPWAIGVVVAGAFMLPLLLADLFGGADPVRQVARVTTEPARAGDTGDAAATTAIPDLRRAFVLPRMRPVSGEAAPPPAPAPAADDGTEAADEPATAGAADATPATPAPASSGGGGGGSSGGGGSAGGTSTGSGGGSGSFENSGTGSGEFESSD